MTCEFPLCTRMPTGEPRKKEKVTVVRAHPLEALKLKISESKFKV